MKMRDLFKMYKDPKEEDTYDAEYSNVDSFHNDYDYEGDEFLDDGLRMIDQEFDQSNE